MRIVAVRSVRSADAIIAAMIRHHAKPVGRHGVLDNLRADGHVQRIIAA